MGTTKLLFVTLLIFSFLSCSDNEDDCADKRRTTIEKYNRLINLAEGDDTQQATLIRNKEAELERLGC